MLELLLTRPFEQRLIEAAQGLRFLVLDELHTYRGRQGADVALLVRRVRDRMTATQLQCVGTSATLATPAAGGTWADQSAEVARVASLLFGTTVRPESVIGETLRRATAPRAAGDPAWAKDDWSAVVAKDPDIFGTAVESAGPAATPAGGLDLDLFPQAWRAVIAALRAEPGLTVDSGGDVADGALVVGTSVAAVQRGTSRLVVLDESSVGAAVAETALGKRGIAALRLSPGADALARILGRLQEIEP